MVFTSIVVWFEALTDKGNFVVEDEVHDIFAKVMVEMRVDSMNKNSTKPIKQPNSVFSNIVFFVGSVSVTFRICRNKSDACHDLFKLRPLCSTENKSIL